MALVVPRRDLSIDASPDVGTLPLSRKSPLLLTLVCPRGFGVLSYVSYVLYGITTTVYRCCLGRDWKG